MSQNHCKRAQNSDAESDTALKLRLCEYLSPDESEKIEKLLLTDWGERWGKPLPAGELLELGRQAFEPMFHDPPLGPIPEHLRPQSSVHSCVAEYEDSLEELERWKALRLNSWLRDRAGKKVQAGKKVYELCLEKGESTATEKYWFKPIDDRSQATPA